MEFGICKLIIESDMSKSMKELGLSSIFEHGWGNGYVLLSHNHPLHGVNYDNFYPDVHGGLTYGNRFDSDNFLHWIGVRDFDGDITIENYDKFHGYWIFGFDTAHYEDNGYNCPKEYVMSETEKLLSKCLDDDIEGMKKYKSFYYRRDKIKRITNL